MVKRIKLILLSAAMVISLVGCGQAADVPESESEEADPEPVEQVSKSVTEDTNDPSGDISSLFEGIIENSEIKTGHTKTRFNVDICTDMDTETPPGNWGDVCSAFICSSNWYRCRIRHCFCGSYQS